VRPGQVSPVVLGTATTVSSGAKATFTINGVATEIQVARDLTIAVGDVAIILRVQQMWVAVGRLFTAAPADVGYVGDVPTPAPSTVSGTLVVSPVETRSYRSSAGWSTDSDDVIQGDPGAAGNYTGVAFYGSTPASLTGATVSSATVRIRRPARGGNPTGQALTLRLVTETTRPAGAPTLSSSTAGPTLTWDTDVDFTLPTSWVQAMVDGTAGGLAVFESDSDPYVVLSGTGDYGPAWTLSINWTR
jgi:hypothetical protein